MRQLKGLVGTLGGIFQGWDSPPSAFQHHGAGAFASCHKMKSLFDPRQVWNERQEEQAADNRRGQAHNGVCKRAEKGQVPDRWLERNRCQSARGSCSRGLMLRLRTLRPGISRSSAALLVFTEAPLGLCCVEADDVKPPGTDRVKVQGRCT